MSEPDPAQQPAAEHADGPPTGSHAAPSHLGLRTAGIGFGAGMLNGLLGVGGGILLVPGMIFLRNATAHVAVATSLGTVLCLSSLALGVHLLLSGLVFSLVGSGALLAAGVVGSLVGSYLLSRTSQRWVLFGFAIFTFAASLELILQGLGAYPSAAGAAQVPPLWAFPSVGMLSGFLSGMLGIGGGGIVVLLFATFFHTPILGGIPLALAVNIVNAGSGVVAQRGTGMTRWPDVGRLVPAAVVGIAVGVGGAVYLPGNVLKVLFGLFFVYMGARLFARGLRS